MCGVLGCAVFCFNMCIRWLVAMCCVDLVALFFCLFVCLVFVGCAGEFASMLMFCDVLVCLRVCFCCAFVCLFCFACVVGYAPVLLHVL